METKTQFDFSTIALDEAYTAFWNRCRGMNVSEKTLTIYNFTAGAFIAWLRDNGVRFPEEVTERHVSAYLASVRERKTKTGRMISLNTVHAHARAVRTLLIYWHEQGYTPNRIKFSMPKLCDTEKNILSQEQLGKILDSAPTARDKAIIAFMADTGARRQEVCNLNWEHIDLKTGAVFIHRGKGNKNRWVGIHPDTRNYLIAYRRKTNGLDLSPDAPVFVSSRSGSRITGQAILLMLRRLSKIVGFHVHPHMLRHTYATAANDAGLSIYDIAQTMGHSDVKTTQRYINSLPSRIIERQIAVSPIARLKRRR